MSQTVPVTSNNKAHLKKKPPVLPEERFWKRYSPHHEFPLSTVSSFVVHALGFGLLVLGAILMARFGFRDKPIEVDTVSVGGGGGNEFGFGNAPNTGVLPSGEEKLE